MIQFDFDEAPIPESVVKEFIDRAYSYTYNRLPRKVKATLL